MGPFSHFVSYQWNFFYYASWCLAYEGEDYPQYLPLNLPKKTMATDDMEHYSINSSTSDAEWAPLFPDGGGFVFLGPQNRPFGVSMFHQFHCLEDLWHAMVARKRSQHTTHCLAYLRQMILCRGDLRIEPLIPPYPLKQVDSTANRTCQDWSLVYRALEQNHSHVKV
ncbi:hypothetical protein GLOTRDRAFT_30602 [Gloeophyllum trabeum ATCC 11539]|uniref:Uncharacterized protein n=1 Tax=Gloeophyllum trabeum (strain ATCC 11539 / FP-39264 / Madison 617) TaxID=670483 RepID=S7QPK6_GLOTA|nr:uncharacterized protein GLOTRDRAFT_30602 [Gloeophyllum trabeum ATCC 11539]EPQ61277.1 hypothetical protein GLOTRDRAFT_30602 [Gloeophyllum trabeum ATCC 11539]